MTVLSRSQNARAALSPAPDDVLLETAEERLDRDAGSETRLDFAVDAEGRTYLARQYAAYPHHITRTFYLDRAAPSAATVYLQSLSGGLTQNDRVTIRVSAAEGSVAHVTTQAATKVHSMERGFARQQQILTALSGSHIEFITDPMICFPRARLAANTELRVAADASAILSESFLWHDPRGENAMAFDMLSTETAIRRPDGSLVALDRSRLTSPGDLMGNPALLGPYRALGSVFAVGRDASSDGTLTKIRASLEALSGIYAGASRLPGNAGLCVRLLAVDGVTLRAAMESAWQTFHACMLGWVSDRRRK